MVIENRRPAVIAMVGVRRSAVGSWSIAVFQLEEIAETVRQAAERVARNGSRTQRADFIADALTLLYEPRENSYPRIELYDPARGPFEAWLTVVLGNLWVSKRRADGRRKMLSLDGREVDESDPFPWELVDGILGPTFSPADYERIEGWNPGDRVILLAVTGLYLKSPDDDWERWLLAAEKVFRVTLPRPFPLAGVADDSPADRHARIALALNMPTNTLSQRWRRKKDLLKELDCVRDLRAVVEDWETNQ
jgi:hypothetical protein